MAWISKALFKGVKLLLINLFAEQICMIMRVLSLFILVYYSSLTDLGSTNQHLLIIQDKTNKLILQMQDQYFQYNYSDPNTLLNLTKNQFWNSFSVPINHVRLLGGIRFIQYTVNLPQNCQYDLYSENEEDQIQFLDSLMSQCNPRDEESLKSMMHSQLTYKSDDLCIEESCKEFTLRDIYPNQYIGIIKRNTVNSIYSESFGTYPSIGYIANVNFESEDEFTQKITNLMDNNWITNTTIAIALQFNLYNDIIDTTISATVLVQLQYQADVGITSTLLQISMKQAYSILWTTFIAILISIDFFFIFKIIFEGSINPKPTQFMIIVNILTEIVFIIITFMETAIFESDMILTSNYNDCSIENTEWLSNGLFSLISPCFNYISFDGIYQFQQIRLVCQALILLFLPFNIFWCFSYLKGTKKLIKFVNMVYRTTVHFMKLLIIRLAIYFGWTLGFFVVFKGNFEIYSNYGNALFAMLIWSIPEDQDEWERGASNSGLYTNAIEICIFKFVRVYLILTLLSFTTIAIYAASDFEFDFRSQSQKDNLEQLALNLKQLEKFQKAYLNENEQKKTDSGKVIAWLSKGLIDEDLMTYISEECDKQGIKIQLLANISDLIQYLDFLFQIKPQLLYRSEVYFRIIVDMENPQSVKQYEIEEEQQNQYFNLIRLLQLLSNIGSRVPFLLNYENSMRPPDSTIILFYKTYRQFYLTNCNFQLLKDFITNENVSMLQKRVYVNEEENQEYDEDDESQTNQMN